jgi:hypothetical protein
VRDSETLDSGTLNSWSITRKRYICN